MSKQYCSAPLFYVACVREAKHSKISISVYSSIPLKHTLNQLNAMSYQTKPKECNTPLLDIADYKIYFNQGGKAL